jgi:hypothetical protein
VCFWLMVRLSPEPVLWCNSRMMTYHIFFNIILTFFGATLFQAKFNPTIFQSSSIQYICMYLSTLYTKVGSLSKFVHYMKSQGRK